MSYWKISDLLPGGRGPNINGINVPECDERGGGVFDHLNLSTRFMSGRYNDFGWMLRSPYTWRGSLIREGTPGVVDFVGDETSSYRHDPSVPPGLLTHGMAHTIDYTMQCSSVYNVKAAIDRLINDVTDNVNPLYNYGDWDSPDIYEPAPLKDDITYSLHGVSPSEYDDLKPGKYYMCIDCTDYDFTDNMTPVSKKIYRPIFVHEFSDTLAFTVNGFEKTGDYTYKFTNGSIVHKDMDYIPQMFNIDYTIKDNSRKTLSTYNKIGVPSQSINIKRYQDGNNEKLNINFISPYAYENESYRDGFIITVANSSSVTVLDSTTEPITSIRAEVVRQPAFNTSWLIDDMKSKYLRVYGTTKSGYTFLMKPSAYTVTVVNPSTTYSKGMSLTLIVTTTGTQNNGTAEVTTRVKMA